MEELNNKFDLMLIKMDEMSESMKFLGSKYDELKSNMKRTIANQEMLNKSVVQSLKENKEQRREISDLKSRIEYLERSSLESTLNLYPVFHTENQDLKGLIKKIGGKINVDISENSILSVYRRPEKKNGKPGEIIVKCLTKEIRDKIVAGVKMKALNHKDIGISCNLGRFYANEELTTEGKNLYYTALKLKYEKKWKYIWVKYGKIYAKQEEGSKAIRIDSMDVIEKLL